MKIFYFFIFLIIFLCVYLSCRWARIPIKYDANTYDSSVDDPRPVIGILTQACFGPRTKFGDQYLASSYVRWLESAGAEVVPVKINQPTSYYEDLFRSLNGLLLPGGGQDLLTSGYAKAAGFFLDRAKVALDADEDVFPVWGTCLGFEQIAVTTENENMLDNCVGCSNVRMATRLEPGVENVSRLWKALPQWAKDTLTERPVTAHYHIKCIRKNTFENRSTLRSEFLVVATASDAAGDEFVDVFEGIRYPFYGVQFHPEKNGFEWQRRLDVAHDADAILASQALAFFFVEEARRSRHRFPTEEARLENLIHNYRQVETGNSIGSVFHFCYFFDS